MFFKPISVKAISISDAWYQLLYNIVPLKGLSYRQQIQRGSFEGNENFRYQYPFVTVSIKSPDQDMVPVMPVSQESLCPTSHEKINDYFTSYIMDPNLAENETYRYASRIHHPMPKGGTQLERVIGMLKETPLTNQAVIEIASPEDFDNCIGNDGKLDPPCLRTIDFKVIPDNGELVLHVSVFFRSWDLWAGFPTNLGGIELLKQYVAQEANLVNGSMVAVSPGLHIYNYQLKVVEERLGIKI